MPHSTKTWLDKLLNLGVLEESASSINYKQVVNLTLSLVCMTDLFITLIFVVHQSFFIACFYFAAFVFSLFCFYLNYKDLFAFVKVMTPLSIISQVVISSLFFFGSHSDFHWLLVTVTAYSFAAFREQERWSRYGLIALSLVMFVVCELFAIGDLLLTEGEQQASAILTFFWALLTVAVVISVVVRRLRKAHNYLKMLAEMDELTGLPNRRKVLLNAISMYTEAVFYHQPCVFAILDLDHFKRINDTFGHDAGDLVLERVSEVMSSCLAKDDEIGRYGGEEFVVIMANTTLKEAQMKMNLLRTEVERAEITTDKGIKIPVTVSIGLATVSERTKRYEDALAFADIALYKAKEEGRNRVAY